MVATRKEQGGQTLDTGYTANGCLFWKGVIMHGSGPKMLTEHHKLLPGGISSGHQVVPETQIVKDDRIRIQC